MQGKPFVAHPYPYKIPAPQLDWATNKKISQWAALEFFRIEALLRSEEVQRLYRKNAKGGTLSEKYGILWDSLDGFHHHLLKASTLQDAGITDLDHWQNVPGGSALHILNPVRTDPSRFLHLQLDCAIPPTTLLKALTPFLVERHRHLKVEFEIGGPAPWLHHPTRRPPILDVSAWLTYFKCYDLRQCYGLSFGKIAEQVFGPVVGKSQSASRRRRSLYDRAERGYKATRRLIRNAVANRWPPQI
jgi:hypothetical protein